MSSAGSRSTTCLEVPQKPSSATDACGAVGAKGVSAAGGCAEGSQGVCTIDQETSHYYSYSENDLEELRVGCEASGGRWQEQAVVSP